MFKALLFVVAGLAVNALASDPSDDRPPIVNIFPMPSSVVQQPGTFKFDAYTEIIADDSCEFEARFLQAMLRPGEGGLPITPALDTAKNYVQLQLDSSRSDLGAEGYELQVEPSRVVITAPTSAGVFYGIETIRQLLPPEIEDPAKAAHAHYQLPCVDIKDKPKFQWRGMMLDVSRHFFDKAAVEHFIDLIAMLKMNVFHWHLADDGGWRIQIKRYPRLTDVGAWRRWSDQLWDYTHLSFPGTDSGDRVYGGYYTQDDIREVVQYAAERHITIVPEIEMPGHSLAALESYPQYICSNVDIAAWQRHSGLPFPNVYCAGKDATFDFLEGVLDEVMQLFPGKFIHIGGDEVDKYLWSNCPDCRKRMEDEGLKSPEELQSYFVKRIEKYIDSKGKRLIGWDEILEGGLAPNAAVMSWRGIDGGIAAAQQGHDVVMSPTSHCYFDYSYEQDSTEHVFDFNPIPPGLTPDQQAHILGGQCNLWTERVPDVPTAEERLFPRIIPLSEDLWSENKDPDLNTFMGRLNLFYARLDDLGINYYVAPPTPEYSAVILNGSSHVAFMQPVGSLGIIRYTTDGKMPTEDSQEYHGPISVSQAMTVTAAFFRGGGIASDPVRVNVVSYSPPDSSNLVPGLNWEVAQGQFDRVPRFDRLTATASGNGTTIGLVGNLKENYGIQYDGFIKIDREGTYTFSTSSDDGSTLYVGGARVVDNDGPHGDIEKEGQIFLRPGVYSFRIGYYQGGGDQDLSATIQGPGLSKQAIPPGMLFRMP